MNTLSTQDPTSIAAVVKQLYVPSSDSHKGQNGKLLVIGGSELFHSSLIWSAEVASHIVDMVHVASPAGVNERIVRERIKADFLNGIVIPWDRVEEYIAEDDCILIGPGMPRAEGMELGEQATGEMVNKLLTLFPDKKWVVDGGALQEVDPHLLKDHMIVTPHHKEWERLIKKDPISNFQFPMKHNDITILLKGPTDVITQGKKRTEIVGGNEGMTKGGTGDILAGLVAALATTNDGFVSAQVASWVNKRAGDLLYQRVGRFFTASDLVAVIPQVLHEIMR